MTSAGGSTPRVLRKRHWSLAVVVLTLVVLGFVYDHVSAPAPTQIGACRVVPSATPSNHTECARTSLAGRDLAGVDLRLADLRAVDLRGADLSGAVLYGADLTAADLRDADLSGSDLTRANLTRARLDDTDFSDAGIDGMNVDGTVLAASQYSRWVDSDDPVLVTTTAGTQPGITTNSCASWEGLYYPGQTPVTCTLATGAEYDGSLSYVRTIEVKVAPTVSAPSEVDLRVGEPAHVHVAAESPFPAVGTSFSAPLPDGLRWDAAAQRVVGTPTARSVGSTTVDFVADNGRQVRTPITFTVSR